MDEKTKFLTPEELAGRWKLHYNTVLSWIQSGEIVAYKFGRQYRVTLDVVEDYESTHTFQPEVR
jgi:excisionase family DNA binding protein